MTRSRTIKRGDVITTNEGSVTIVDIFINVSAVKGNAEAYLVYDYVTTLGNVGTETNSLTYFCKHILSK